MKAQLTVVTLITSDVRGMARFYREALGFAVAVDTEHYAELENEGTRFSLSSRDLMTEQSGGHPTYMISPSGQAVELCFRLESPESVRTAYSHLLSCGAGAVKEPTVMPWGHMTAFFSDPEGISIRSMRNRMTAIPKNRSQLANGFLVMSPISF
ncbi:glyoxalase [Paenibacillus sp. 1011MAR3C5]|uniref:VOC family protein n=1 Tax=Paenibacillus sp. 1011MAR3C5 TaxID=1675787 RepID=UPI000E6BABD7|nr:VOC family protein [Paenibacillus sp. 1011MAR3C5]RJE90130.1 glyoxalase [Paenibacillus sp. 1011MAR3C5]